jgi:hypothetical protein
MLLTAGLLSRLRWRCALAAGDLASAAAAYRHSTYTANTESSNAGPPPPPLDLAMRAPCSASRHRRRSPPLLPSSTAQLNPLSRFARSPFCPADETRPPGRPYAEDRSANTARAQGRRRLPLGLATREPLLWGVCSELARWEVGGGDWEVGLLPLAPAFAVYTSFWISGRKCPSRAVQGGWARCQCIERIQQSIGKGTFFLIANSALTVHSFIKILENTV